MKKIILTIGMMFVVGSAEAADAGSGDAVIAGGSTAAAQPSANTAGDNTSVTSCWILVTSNQSFCAGAGHNNGVYKVNASFQDTEGEANLNAGRCLERAREYANWCGDTVQAQAYFIVKGSAVIHSVHVKASQQTILGNGVSRAINP